MSSLDGTDANRVITGLAASVCQNMRKTGVRREEEGFSYVYFSTGLSRILREGNYRNLLAKLDFQVRGKGKEKIFVSEFLETIFDSMHEWSAAYWNDRVYVISNISPEIAQQKLDAFRRDFGREAYQELERMAESITGYLLEEK